MNLWRDGAPIFVADPPPFHPLSWLGLPEPLLVVAGIATIAFSTDRFVREPRLARWLELTLVAALAALGLDPNLLPILLAVVAWRALRGGVDDARLAGLVGATVVAALLSAFWWLPALEVSKWEPRPASAVPFDHIPASVAGHVANDHWQLIESNLRWWPGWRVYANGRRVPPVIVHGTNAGAFVPPGAVDVRFRYRPDSFDQGLRLTALGLLLFATSPLWRRVRFRRSLPVPQLAIAALLLYAGVLLAHRGGTAGGADSSGYLNQSRLWRSGSLSVPLDVPRQLGLPPGLFIPLGFVPGTQPGTMVPSYPIGLPLHLALVALIGGEPAQALVSPLAAIGCILLFYLIARRLGISRDWSIVAAAVLALCPVLLFQGVQPMSDVVATFWTLAGVGCALRSRAGGAAGFSPPNDRLPGGLKPAAPQEPDTRLAYALGAGAAFGIGVLVRPTHMLLLPAMLLLLGLRWRALLAFAVGGLPFAAVQMSIATLWYGSPFRSGYGVVLTDLALANFPTRFLHYSWWLAVLLTPLVFPLAFTGALSKWTEARTRAALVLWFAAFFLFYCFYGPYETWWYTRFLLPAIPALILLGAGFASARTAHLARALPLVTLVVVAAVQVAVSRNFRVLGIGQGEAVYQRAATVSRAHLPPGAIVLAMQHSGAFLYYTGITPLRYDYLDRGLFETVRATGKPIYALVGDFELEPLRLRTTGRWEPVERFGSSALYRHVAAPVE